jgi:L-ascorbate metabolism protein UlaG (beta-lactamase superfamily)
MAFPISDHCTGRRFHNVDRSADRTMGQVARLMTTVRPARWPSRLDDVLAADPPGPLPEGEISATFIGHATFLVRIGAAAFLFDPVWYDRAGPFGIFGPRRVRRPALALDRVPPLAAILVSHNHYDHMDLPTLRTLSARLGAPIVTGLGNESYLARMGVSVAGALDWWGEHRLEDGTRIVYVPAQHASARGFGDHRRALWGGFVVEREGTRVYFAADTGYCSVFRSIRERLGAPDLALLPIGSYDPRWFMKAVHMNPEEAVQAHLDLEARRSVAMHFGTFRLTEEPVGEPAERLKFERAARGIAKEDFRVPRFGETLHAARALTS